MAGWWAFGTDPEGNQQLIGPFDWQEAADLEADNNELRQVRVFSAPDRATAQQQVQQSGRPQQNLLATDGPPQPFDPSRFPQLQQQGDEN